MLFYQDLSAEAKIFARIFVFLLLLGIFWGVFAIGFFYFVSGWKAAVDSGVQRQFAVEGVGKAFARPDIVSFMATVVTQASKVGEAQAENSRRSNAALGFLKGEGVDEKDLKSASYNISPQYQYDRRPCIQIYPNPCSVNPPVVASYEVRHTIQVKVRDQEKVDDLLAGVVAKGANEVGSVWFGIDDEEKIKAEARAKAISDAKKKAEQFAADLGVKLSHIVSFSESGGGIPVPYRVEAYSQMSSLKEAAPAPEIAIGEQEVTVNVSLVYEFR